MENTNTSKFPQGIPEEQVVNILSRLPIKVLIRLSCVCKFLFNLIHHDHKTPNNYLSSSHFLHYSLNNQLLIFKFFRKKQLYYYPSYHDRLSLSLPWSPWRPSIAPTLENSFFYLDKFSELCQTPHKKHNLQKLCQDITSTYKRNPIGYCNGLFCFLIRDHSVIEVCNPSRHQILAISIQQYDSDVRFCGFGMDTVTKEYKIVCILFGFECMVYTLGIDSWREVKSLIPGDVMIDDAEDSSLFCNGVLYWKSSSSGLLVGFDLHDEKFHVIQLPPKFVHDERYIRSMCRGHYHMSEFKGSLCVARVNNESDRETRKIKVYTLNTTSTDETEQEWMKKTFHLPPSATGFEYDIVSYFDQLLYYWTDNKHDSIMIYNLHTGEENMVHQPDAIFYCYEVTNHIENFLSLEAFVQEGTARFFDSYPCLKSIKRVEEASTALLFLFSYP